MDKFVIKGPCKVNGEVIISGSKNASLPILASTILFDKTVTIGNLPRVKDIDTMLNLLKSLGSKIKKDGAAEEEGEFEPIENLAQMKKEMKEAIEEMKKENPAGDPPIDIETSSKGLIVNIKGDFAFPSGKADMKPELMTLLDTEIIPRIQASPFQVEVAGHSDSDPLPKKWQKFYLRWKR